MNEASNPTLDEICQSGDRVLRIGMALLRLYKQKDPLIDRLALRKFAFHLGESSRLWGLGEAVNVWFDPKGETETKQSNAVASMVCQLTPKDLSGLYRIEITEQLTGLSGENRSSVQHLLNPDESELPERFHDEAAIDHFESKWWTFALIQGSRQEEISAAFGQHRQAVFCRSIIQQLQSLTHLCEVGWVWDRSIEPMIRGLQTAMHLNGRLKTHWDALKAAIDAARQSAARHGGDVQQESHRERYGPMQHARASFAMPVANEYREQTRKLTALLQMIESDLESPPNEILSDITRLKVYVERHRDHGLEAWARPLKNDINSWNVLKQRASKIADERMRCGWGGPELKKLSLDVTRVLAAGCLLEAADSLRSSGEPFSNLADHLSCDRSIRVRVISMGDGNLPNDFKQSIETPDLPAPATVLEIPGRDRQIVVFPQRYYQESEELASLLSAIEQCRSHAAQDSRFAKSLEPLFSLIRERQKSFPFQMRVRDEEASRTFDDLGRLAFEIWQLQRDQAPEELRAAASQLRQALRHFGVFINFGSESEPEFRFVETLVPTDVVINLKLLAPSNAERKTPHSAELRFLGFPQARNSLGQYLINHSGAWPALEKGIPAAEREPVLEALRRAVLSPPNAATPRLLELLNEIIPFSGHGPWKSFRQSLFDLIRRSGAVPLPPVSDDEALLSKWPAIAADLPWVRIVPEAPPENAAPAVFEPRLTIGRYAIRDVGDRAATAVLHLSIGEPADETTRLALDAVCHPEAGRRPEWGKLRGIVLEILSDSRRSSPQKIESALRDWSGEAPARSSIWSHLENASFEPWAKLFRHVRLLPEPAIVERRRQLLSQGGFSLAEAEEAEFGLCGLTDRLTDLLVPGRLEEIHRLIDVGAVSPGTLGQLESLRELLSQAQPPRRLLPDHVSLLGPFLTFDPNSLPEVGVFTTEFHPTLPLNSGMVRRFGSSVASVQWVRSAGPPPSMYDKLKKYATQLESEFELDARALRQVIDEWAGKDRESDEALGRWTRERLLGTLGEIVKAAWSKPMEPGRQASLRKLHKSCLKALNDEYTQRRLGHHLVSPAGRAQLGTDWRSSVKLLDDVRDWPDRSDFEVVVPIVKDANGERIRMGEIKVFS